MLRKRLLSANHLEANAAIREALDTLGWTQAALAERLGVHVNTVSGWSTGRTSVPGPVAAYLTLAVDVARLLK